MTNLRRHALHLAYFTIAYNVVECVLALVAGSRANGAGSLLQTLRQIQGSSLQNQGNPQLSFLAAGNMVRENSNRTNRVGYGLREVYEGRLRDQHREAGAVGRADFRSGRRRDCGPGFRDVLKNLAGFT